METNTLPLYEVEFLPVERRLRDRRQQPAVARPPMLERRRGERRLGEHAGANGSPRPARQ